MDPISSEKEILNLIDRRRSPQIADFNSLKMKELYIDCSAGSLRVLHLNHNGISGKRPVVFLPGWGTLPDGFMDFFRMTAECTECYYIETREKNSSRLPGKRPPMHMDRNAEDLAEILSKLHLTAGTDFVIMGTCWGATILAHTLSRGIINPPTSVLFDPMPRLWFPRWLLKTAVPLIPARGWEMLRPIGRNIALCGMKEETQRKRVESFINSADIRKWHAAADANSDYNLLEHAPNIQQQIYVFTGVNDKIHDQSRYPAFVKAAQNARFFNTPVDESDREFLLGLIADEFASVKAEYGVPEVFGQYEIKL